MKRNKKNKKIADLNPRDPAWIVIPGVIDSTFKNIILHPSVVRVAVTGTSITTVGNRTEVTVSVTYPTSDRGLAYMFPTEYKTVITRPIPEEDKKYFPEERALAETYYDDRYDDVYMGEDFSHPMILNCFSDKKMAIKRFSEECDSILEETSSYYQAQKKKLLKTRQEYDNIKKFKEKTIVKMKEEEE
jgi:hypothetical protein